MRRTPSWRPSCAIELLNGTLAQLVTVVVPSLELLTGLMLLAGIQRRLAGSVCILLGVAFTIAQTSALARGLDISCGCIGSTSEPIGWFSIGRAIALTVAGCFLCIALPKLTPTADSLVSNN
ncbi:MAG: MauE/DoxX family redox-associated membrane protein [Tepidisphaeraceae bacterium]